jgi:hypothetical protein
LLEGDLEKKEKEAKDASTKSVFLLLCILMTISNIVSLMTGPETSNFLPKLPNARPSSWKRRGASSKSQMRNWKQSSRMCVDSFVCLSLSCYSLDLFLISQARKELEATLKGLEDL